MYDKRVAGEEYWQNIDEDEFEVRYSYRGHDKNDQSNNHQFALKEDIARSVGNI